MVGEPFTRELMTTLNVINIVMTSTLLSSRGNAEDDERKLQTRSVSRLAVPTLSGDSALIAEEDIYLKATIVLLLLATMVLDTSPDN